MIDNVVVALEAVIDQFGIARWSKHKERRRIHGRQPIRHLDEDLTAIIEDPHGPPVGPSAKLRRRGAAALAAWVR